MKKRSYSSIETLLFQAMQLYPTKSLFQFLEDRSCLVRDTAARELQIRGERSAFERAVQLLKYKAAYKRETATFLLGQLGTPKYPYRAESIPLIEKMCKDKDIGVRNTAITSLGHLRAKESIGLMLEAAHDEDAGIRIAAAFALSMVLPDARAEEALEVLKNDPDEEVRYWAED